MSDETPQPYALPPGKVLILRTCDADMKSYNGFVWPASGPVSAPDWSPEPECGHGLHGLLWGEGEARYLDLSLEVKGLAVEADEAPIADLGGNVKFPAGNVVHCGSLSSAAAFIAAVHGNGDRIVCGIASATGVKGSASATGYQGSASATGYQGSASATGYQGSASATGDQGSASATGDQGSASATGDQGSASATGYQGSASATGDQGSASATGDQGSASATGKEALALGWASSTIVSAGPGGTLALQFHDERHKRFRLIVGYVGEEGLKARVRYRLDDQGRFIPASEQDAERARRTCGRCGAYGDDPCLRPDGKAAPKWHAGRKP